MVRTVSLKLSTYGWIVAIMAYLLTGCANGTLLQERNHLAVYGDYEHPYDLEDIDQLPKPTPATHTPSTQHPTSDKKTSQNPPHHTSGTNLYNARLEKLKQEANKQLRYPKRKRFRFSTGYPKIPGFAGRTITFASENATLSKALYAIFEGTNYNVLIESDLDRPVTISVKDAPLQEFMEMLMDVADTTYAVKGNIIHVKKFMEKSFYIPYISSGTQTNYSLGGDILSSSMNGSGGGGGGGGGLTGSYTLTSGASGQQNTSFYDQLEQNIKSLLSPEGTYTLNRFSHILVVRDRKRNVDMVAKMLERVMNNASRQVLIEAKIFEVALNRSHQTGISWRSVFDTILERGDTLEIGNYLGTGGGVSASMAYSSELFQLILTAMKQAGDVEIISSPHLQVVSGQSAIISSGKLVPFYEKSVNTNQGTGGSATTTIVNYQRRDLLDGLVLGVMPIVMDNDTIMLNVTPISANIEQIQDFLDENGNIIATAPIVNVKELGTTIYAKDNSLISIGGLITESKNKSHTAVPFLSDLPVVGDAFKNNQQSTVKRELVILMRVKVIH